MNNKEFNIPKILSIIIIIVISIFISIVFIIDANNKNLEQSDIKQNLSQKESEKIEESKESKKSTEASQDSQKEIEKLEMIEEAFDIITTSEEKLYGCVLTNNEFTRENMYLKLINTKKTEEINSLAEGFFSPNFSAKLMPRMGYIQCYDNDKKIFLTNTGKHLPETAQYLGICDRQKKPLFIDKGIVGTFNEELLFVPSSYDAFLDGRGAELGYEFISEENNSGISLIYKNGKYGYLNNQTGKNIVGNLYEDAYYYKDGYGCAYDKNQRLFVFDEQGGIVVDGAKKKYYFCTDNNICKIGYGYYDNGFTRANANRILKGKEIVDYGREILIDKEGNEFNLPMDYKVYSYSNGIICLEKNGKFGFMNTAGEWICDPIYTYVEPFSEGLAVVGFLQGKFGMIDKNGDFVFPLLFDGITSCSGGVITLYNRNLGWFVVNKVMYKQK